MFMLKMTAAALLAGSLALPALAQTSTSPALNHGPSATGAPATGSVSTPGNTTPSDRNPVMTDDGSMRASKIVGSSVYNDKDEKIGSIDDLVISKDKTLNAVLSVGGFLGMGAKMVEVPFDRLQFGNTNHSGDNRVVMPGMTKDALNGMPDYHYTNRG
jgi:sporulation protein YlmC with PRC-barrel domain